MGNPDQPRDKKGRWTKISGVALAGTLTVGVGVAALGPGGTTSATSGSGKGGSRSGTAQTKAKDGDVGRLVRRLQSNDLRVEPVATSSDPDCASNSYGRIRVYFADHPCSALFRALLGSPTGTRRSPSSRSQPSTCPTTARPGR